MTFVDSLLRAAELDPKRIALDARGLQLSYGQLARNARAIASGLSAHGVTAGASVAVLLPSGGALVQSIYGAWMNGNVVVPLSDQAHLTAVMRSGDGPAFGALIVSAHAVPELEHVLRVMHREPRVFVVGDPGRHPSYDRLLEAAPIGAVRYPQGSERALAYYGQNPARIDAMLTSDNLAAQIHVCGELLSVTASDRWLNVMSSGDPFGLLMTLTCLNARASVLTRADAYFGGSALASHLRDEQITLFAARAPLLKRLHEYARGARLALPRLLRCVELGGRLPVETRILLEEALAAPVDRAYFAKEAGLVSCDQRGQRGQRVGRLESAVGIPHRSFLIRIEDDHGRPLRRGDNGRILLRGPAVGTRPYIADRASTLHARFPGWLATTSYGRLELDGTLIHDPLRTPDAPVVPEQLEGADAGAATQAPPTLSAFVRTYLGYVFRVLRSMGIPQHDLEDTVTQVFLKVRASLCTNKTSLSTKAWLWGICRECAAQYRKGSHHLKQQPLISHEPPAQGVREESRPMNDAREALRRALRELPVTLRYIFLLKEVEELPMQDIAILLGCSINAARVGHHRALTMIRSRLRPVTPP